MAVADTVAPRTSEEARILLNQAIARVEFETAEQLYQELQDLILLEQERNLSNIVVGYFDQNQALSNQFDRNCGSFATSQDRADKTLQVDFETKFNLMKEEHQQEMSQLLQDWRKSRKAGSENVEANFQRTLKTARLLAQDFKFKEAISIRDEALLTKVKAHGQSNTRIDAHFDSQFNLMLDRHQCELDTLIHMRDSNVDTFKRRKEEGTQGALDCFQVDNAENVIGLVEQFSPGAKMPFSLRMQTVHGRTQPRREGFRSGRSPDFKDRKAGIATFMQTLPAPKRANTSSTLANKSKKGAKSSPTRGSRRK